MQLRLAALLDLGGGDVGRRELCSALLNQFGEAGDGYETRILHILIRKLHVELRLDICDELDDLHGRKPSAFKIVGVSLRIAMAVNFAPVAKPIFEPVLDVFSQVASLIFLSLDSYAASGRAITTLQL
jgi:hypothetical protein